MAYTKQIWTDETGAGDGTVFTASRMNHIENGIESAGEAMDGAGLHVGPDAPAGSEELWIDTDEPGVDLSTLRPQRVTSLPAGPSDGQEIYFVADAANGVIWHLRYNAAGGTYKWEFVGGSPLSAEVLTLVSTNVTAGVGGGPNITLPLAGDYDVTIGAHVHTVGPNYCHMTYDIGSTTAVNSDGIEVSDVATDYDWHERTRRKTGLGAVMLACRYVPRGNSSTQYWRDRIISARPVRVG